MNSNTVAYWIALGVLALGLHSEYRQGNFETLHRVADRADSVLCRLSTRAERTLVAARALTGRREFTADDLLASTDADEMSRVEVARENVQGQIRAQADMIRAQVEMQRAQVRQIQSATRSQVRMARVVSHRVLICPKTGVRVVVNTSVDSDDDSGNSNE